MELLVGELRAGVAEEQRRAFPAVPFAFDLQRFSEDEERTEPATPRHREEARKRGQVAKTHELGTALVLLAGAGGLYVSGSRLVQGMEHVMRSALGGQLVTGDVTQSAVARLFQRLTWDVFLMVLPFALLAAVVGLTSQLVQVGFLFTTDPIQPKIERVNPIAGLKRIFSSRAVVELVKSLLKVIIIGGIAFSTLQGSVSFLPRLMERPPEGAALWVARTAWRTVTVTGLALLFVALLDYAYQRYEYEKSLRMTKKQVLEEYKQTEGDPLVRRRLRERQRQLATRRMMQQVPTADVVITNPTHYAVALKYDMETMEAPIVVAKGIDAVALRIRQIAREHGVFIVEDRWLARALYDGVEIGHPVPEQLYQAVARVLAFVYRVRNRRGPEGAETR